MSLIFHYKLNKEEKELFDLSTIDDNSKLNETRYQSRNLLELFGYSFSVTESFRYVVYEEDACERKETIIDYFLYKKENENNTMYDKQISEEELIKLVKRYSKLKAFA